MRVEDLLKRNIVSVAWVFGIETDKERVVDAVKAASTLSDGTELLNHEALERTINDILSGELVFVEFEPSWGASIFVVCKTIRIDNIPYEEWRSNL